MFRMATATRTKAPRWTGEWAELQTHVIDPGLCTGCAGCVVACPHGVLRLDSDSWNPVLIGDAVDDGDVPRCARGGRGCTLCTRACPRYRDWESDGDRVMFGGDRTSDEVAGIYQDLHLAEATDAAVADAGQDGGFASALLIYALAHDFIDGALVSYYDAEWGTVPGVATTRDEVLAAAGSRYTYSSNLLAFKEALQLGLSRLAVVGVGCQVSVPPVAAGRGARKMSRKIALTVGLLCSKTFSESIFEDLFEARYGVARREITKINIKGRLQLWLDREPDEDYLEIPLKQARRWTRPGCVHCPDFAAAHADLSLGGIGAFEGRTLTVVRSDLGRQLVDEMQRDGWIEVHDAIAADPGAVALMEKLARVQRRRAGNRVISSQ